jgi:uncharacterized membrane protein
VSGSPATTGLGDADFETLRSASVVTVATALPMLFPATGSAVVLVAVAEFDIVGAEYDVATVPVICSVALDPAAKVPTAQVAVARVHDPRLVDSPDTVKPEGSESVTDTDWASEGPLLVTTMVQTAAPPAWTLAGLTDFVTIRSAEAVVVTAAEAALLAVFASGVADVAATLLVKVVPETVDAAMRAVMVMLIGVPTASVPSRHEITPDDSVQVTPVGPTAATKVIPAGKVSVTDVPSAVDGPAFDAVTIHVATSPAATD